MDEAGQLTLSTVFSADEPESAYLLNGLTHNELFIPDAHIPPMTTGILYPVLLLPISLELTSDLE